MTAAGLKLAFAALDGEEILAILELTPEQKIAAGTEPHFELLAITAVRLTSTGPKLILTRGENQC